MHSSGISVVLSFAKVVSSRKHAHEKYIPASKSGVYRSIHIILIFDPKHTLWELVRTAWARRFQHVPTIDVLNKNNENMIFFFSMNFSIFNEEKIAWACFRYVPHVFNCLLGVW